MCWNAESLSLNALQWGVRQTAPCPHPAANAQQTELQCRCGLTPRVDFYTLEAPAPNFMEALLPWGPSGEASFTVLATFRRSPPTGQYFLLSNCIPPAVI